MSPYTPPAAPDPALPKVVLPPELLPRDGRFGSGPSKVRHEQLDALAANAAWLGTSHRQAPVQRLVGDLRQGLSQFFSLPPGYEIVLGNGGASAFWDIATACLVRERAQHVVVGEFSAKFAAATTAAPFLLDPQVRRAGPGSACRAQVIDDGASVDVYAWPHNETSTGVMLPVERVVDAGDDALMVIDGTSGAGGLPIDLSEADAYYFAPQKCFGSDGGLWLAVLSPAAIARADEIATHNDAAGGRWIPGILDLRAAIENSRKDQTLNTPALATVLLMLEQVRWLNELGGLAWAVARCEESARIVYDWAHASDYARPFVAHEPARSRVVTTIDIAGTVDAGAITSILRGHGIVDLEPYRKLGRNQLRIGVYPAVEPSDVAALTRCIDAVVAALRA
ncbi:MAG: phosphoserine transaminase [Micrococcales bacterium]|nr:phosphoserine transaminase [Micrococcales bacterium]